MQPRGRLVEGRTTQSHVAARAEMKALSDEGEIGLQTSGSGSSR